MKKVLLVFVIVFLSMSMGNAVVAEEGSYTEEGSHDEMMEVAIDGYCPVCVLDGMMTKGNDDFHAKYEGKIYKFLGEEQKVMFWEDPEKYVEDLESKYMDLKTQSMQQPEGSH